MNVIIGTSILSSEFKQEIEKKNVITCSVSIHVKAFDLGQIKTYKIVFILANQIKNISKIPREIFKIFHEFL